PLSNLMEVQREAAARHDNMHVRVMGHCRAPAVQHRSEADASAEMPDVTAQRRRSAALEGLTILQNIFYNTVQHSIGRILDEVEARPTIGQPPAKLAVKITVLRGLCSWKSSLPRIKPGGWRSSPTKPPWPSRQPSKLASPHCER